MLLQVIKRIIHDEEKNRTRKNDFCRILYLIECDIRTKQSYSNIEGILEIASKHICTHRFQVQHSLLYPSELFLPLFSPLSLSLLLCSLFYLLLFYASKPRRKKILFSPSPSLALTHILLYKYHQAKYWNRTSYESRRAGIVVLFSLSDFSFLLSFIIPLWNMGNKQAKTNSTELTPKRMSPSLIDFFFSIDWF